MLQAMKIGLASAVVALSAARLCPWCGGSPVGAATLAAAEVQAPDTAVARVAIQGMTCGSCATTARLALQRLTGVYHARISYDSASAVVRYDPRRVTPERIAQHLRRMTGYRATLTAEDSAVGGRQGGG
ncbi:MAG: heavy metal-associated domain-containing protein [Gemmatimonadales bacterium]|nr:heavy metal-associated domain-containing protein [Gemmatimonadales bacterium]